MQKIDMHLIGPGCREWICPWWQTIISGHQRVNPGDDGRVLVFSVRSLDFPHPCVHKFYSNTVRPPPASLGIAWH